MPGLKLRDSMSRWIRRIVPTRDFMVLFLLSVLSLTLIISIPSGSGQLRKTEVLPADGVINYGEHLPHGLTLKYSADFEGVTKANDYSLNMGINNYFQTTGDFSIWMEGLDRQSGITAHSGIRSVGMETIGGYRNEFNILHMENIVSAQYYVSVWLRFPSGWDVPSGGWYALGNPFAADYPDSSGLYLPLTETHIHEDEGAYDTAQEYGTGSGKYILGSIPNCRPPVGQWFRFEYYVYMHPTDGKLKVWIDGRLLVDVSNLKTVDTLEQAMLTGISKIYFSSSVTSTYQLWVDDLQIYGD